MNQNVEIMVDEKRETRKGGIVEMWRWETKKQQIQKRQRRWGREHWKTEERAMSTRNEDGSFSPACFDG
jgi:hypothetical protein